MPNSAWEACSPVSCPHTLITKHVPPVLQPVSQAPALDRQGCWDTQSRQRWWQCGGTHQPTNGYVPWPPAGATHPSKALPHITRVLLLHTSSEGIGRNKRDLTFLMALGLLPCSLNVQYPGIPPHPKSQKIKQSNKKSITILSLLGLDYLKSFH